MDPFRVMATWAFHEEVVQQVNDCMVPVQDDYDTIEADQKPLAFQAVLGNTDNDYWWLLYIDRKDWEAASAMDDPRLKYNLDDQETDTPKDFRTSMVLAYQKYLVHGALNECFEPGARLTCDQYFQMWEDTKPRNRKGENNPPFEARQYDRDVIQFGGPEQIANDALLEFLPAADGGDPWPLVAESTASKPLVLYVHNDRQMSSKAYGNRLREGIERVFLRFRQEMHDATLRSHQLLAIARAIRSLHIIHAFSNGCGRTNVSTLLPLMLLRYGFGLPLGGQHGQTVDRRAIFMLFNGGYSVDEIARFLWVMQDFGSMDRSEGRTTSVDLYGKPIVKEDKEKCLIS